MTINNYKFTDSDFIGQGVSDLPDRPSQAGISAAQLKARFDNIAKIIVALGKVNGLLDYLQTGAAGADIGIMDGGAASKLQNYIDSLLSEVGAGKIGMNALYDNDQTGATVKDKLLYLSNMIRGAVRFTPRGIKNSTTELPLSGNEYGDFFYVRTADPNTYDNYIWTSIPDRWENFGQVSQYTIDEINDQIRKISNGITQRPSIGLGMNSVIRKSDGVVAIPQITFTGKDQTNRLGRDGNCEDVSKWTAYRCTLSLDSTKRVYGLNSIKTTLTSTNGFGYKTLNSFAIDITKYYIMSAFLANGNATSVYIAKDGSGGGNYISSQEISSTNFTRVGLKIKPSDINAGNGIGFALNGVSGQYAYVDGIMVKEITADEYNNLTVDQLLKEYPCADSYACVQNPYIEIRHDNLVRNGSCEEGTGWWTPNDPANIVFSISATGKFQMVCASVPRTMYQIVSVKKNTDYYLSATVSGVGYTSINDIDDTVQLRNGAGAFNSGAYDKIKVYIGCSIVGTGYASSVHLIEGTSAPVAYKPCRIERCVIEGKFTSDDTITLENGKAEGLLWWKHPSPLYGKDYDWQYESDFTGYKRITLNNILGSISAIPINIKYDGKVLPWGTEAADGCSSVGSKLYYGSLDSDTGWAETLNPNADEVKAFMNGWRAVQNNGSRYQAWVSMVDASVPAGAVRASVSATTNIASITVSSGGTQYASGDIVAVISPAGVNRGATTVTGTPTATNIPLTGALNVTAGDIVVKADNGSTNVSLLTWCKNNVAPGYEGYQLHYKLANPEPIADANPRVIGDIPKLDNGDNYIYVDSGMVLGEEATPTYDSTYLVYHLNIASNPWSSPSPFKNKNESIRMIYKNLISDVLNWSLISDSYAYGNQRAYKAASSFDPSAIYTVDYQILKTMHTTPGSVSMQYQQDLTSAVSDLAESVNNLRKAGSAILATKADKVQKDWITPTLINGWVNYNGNTHETAGYYKDNFGVVHLKGIIKSGTIPGYVFNLPVGYRPSKNKEFPVASFSTFGNVGIDTAGVYIEVGSPTWLSLDGISFKV